MGVVLDVGVGSLFGLLQASAALVLVGALAWLSRRLLLQKRLAHTRSALRIEERLSIDLRSALVIVRVEQRRFLLATGERGPARLIAELASESALPSSSAHTSAVRDAGG
jgi:flagellar biogenesis protein FliO